MRWSLLLFTALTAAVASAQEEAAFPDEASLSLKGVGRISIQSGWRLTSNDTFYDRYYSRSDNEGLPRASGSPGGPFLAGSFAYAVTELVELGIDLFATGERLRLTGQPRLLTITYGALFGLRFQGVVEGIGPHGLVPFLGIFSGPVLASAKFEGHKARERATQAWVGTVGATLRLSPRWGLNAEYRLAFARGTAETREQKFGTFNAGGNWFALGVTYVFPPERNNPLDDPF